MGAGRGWGPSAVAHLGGWSASGSGGIPGSGGGPGRPGRGEDVQAGLVLHIFTPPPRNNSRAFPGIPRIALDRAGSIAVKMCKRGWSGQHSGHRGGCRSRGSRSARRWCALAAPAAPPIPRGTLEGRSADGMPRSGRWCSALARRPRQIGDTSRQTRHFAEWTTLKGVAFSAKRRPT